MATDVKYPDITVDLGNLNGPEGNAFAILGKVAGAMREAGLSKEEIDTYMTEAKKGSYGHLLRTTMATVNTVLDLEEDDEEDDDFDDEDDYL